MDMKIMSTELSSTGRASPGASWKRKRTSLCLARARSIIFDDGSTPSTLASKMSASAPEKRPVPQPRSMILSTASVPMVWANLAMNSRFLSSNRNQQVGWHVSHET